jgi:phospholipase C
VPALTKLADRYVVSDRTFTMQDSPSWGGHVYVAAASQDNFTGDIPQQVSGVPAGPGWGCDSNRVQTWIDPVTHAASQQPSCIPAPSGTLDPQKYPNGGAFRSTPVESVPTIFDRLDATAQSWKLYTTVYGWSICPNFGKCLYTQQRTHMTNTVNVLNDARLGRLPAYSVVLPSGPGATGQHAPSSMLVGDNWIGKVVDAIRTGPQWGSTAIFITYDDCGCFYDHVAPGTNPDGTRQGLRVPMLIVSPYTKVGYVDSQPATFASILRFAEESLGLDPLGVNDTGAYDFADSFNFAAPARRDVVRLKQARVPDSTVRFLARHPEILDPDDDT